MQIKGEEFIKKVQIQQEREELERKLNELEEVPLDDGVVSLRTYPMVGGMSKCFNDIPMFVQLKH